ncbi:SPFH domain-containing protein [Oscillospiraceae bacterium PP1C4]
MGLIRNAVESVKGALADQYKTAVDCGDLGNHILMMKKTNPNGIIRNGSRIILNPGQLAVLIDNGKVLDACAEPGVYTFESSASPSFFAGKFGAVFKEMWMRLTFGGAGYQDQAIYFMNSKEIIDNGFGTPAPVMYRDWEHCMSDARNPGRGVPMRVAIRCCGNYTFQIDRPDVFMQKIGGTAQIYQKDEICEQMRLEIISSFQAVLNSLCSEQNRIFPLDIPAQSFLIKQLMDQQVFDTPIRNRGMRIVGFNVVRADLDEDSKHKIDEYEKSGDMATQQARMVTAAQLAASNDAGAGVGFFSMGMMNQGMGGGMFQGPQAMSHPQSSPVLSEAQKASPAHGLICTSCGASVNGKFCASCGAPAPIPASVRFCTNCGAKANGKFCSECGMTL